MTRRASPALLASLICLLAAAGAGAADTACRGAQGDRATPAGSKIGVPLPDPRSCLNPDVLKVLDGNSEDWASGLAVDGSGNAVIAGETKSFKDKTYGDIFVAKLDPQGGLLWMATYGGPQDDGIHPHDENSEGEGQDAMVDVDESGAVYVVGRSKSAEQAVYAGVAMKLNPDGSLAWSKLFRPQWDNRAGMSAEFHAARVRKGVLHIVGVVEGETKALLLALKADTGAVLAKAFVDPTPGSNDRFYSLAVPPQGDAVYVGGWAGAGGPGLLMKFDFVGGSYKPAWGQLVEIGRGSNFPSLDVDDAGGLYAVADIHGAKTHAELHRYDAATGKLTWARRYNAGAANDKTQTSAVKVAGGSVFLAGKIGLTGTYTHADSFGDGYILRLDPAGKLQEELFFFTGTNPKSFDIVKDVAVVGQDLYWVANHFGPAMVGEWRRPADYDEIKHPWTEVDRREVAVAAIKPAVETGSPLEAKDGEGLKGLAFNTVTEDAYCDPVAKDTKPRSAQVYFGVFKDFLK